MYKFNSAFLFSTARNNAKRPIVKINQGEKPISEAATPERALNIKPDAMHKTSKIGSFLNNPFTDKGYMMVDFFFILSGFVISLNYFCVWRKKTDK